MSRTCFMRWRSQYRSGRNLIVLALLPKIAHVVASVPPFVLGHAGIVMFGMGAAAGIRILGTFDFEKNRHALFVTAVSVGMGLIPTLSPSFSLHLPAWAHAVTDRCEHARNRMPEHRLYRTTS